MLPHNQTLFGRVPHQPQRPQGAKKGRLADNEAKIAGLQALSRIVTDCRRRTLAWGMFKVHEREKAVLTRSIALNKLTRFVQERIREHQTKFMEAVFSVAAEGDFELEDLLKNSQRNSLSNESRFSTLWRNLNTSTGNRPSHASSSGNPLKGLDLYLQQVLDKANASRDSHKEADFSLMSAVDPFRELNKTDAKHLETDRHFIGRHEVGSHEELPLRIENRAFNKQAGKTEDLFSSQQVKSKHRIERLLLLEREFVQLGRLFRGLQVRLQQAAFSTIRHSSLLKQLNPELKTHTMSPSLPERERKIRESQLHQSIKFISVVVNDMILKNKLSAFCSVMEASMAPLKCLSDMEHKSELIDDEREGGDDSEVDIESLRQSKNRNSNRQAGGLVQQRDLSFLLPVINVFTRTKQETLVALFERAFERQRRNLAFDQGVHILENLIYRLQVRKSLHAIADSAGQSKRQEQQMAVVYLLNSLLATAMTRSSFHRLLDHFEHSTAVTCYLTNLTNLLACGQTSAKFAGFVSLKASYFHQRRQEGLELLSRVIARSRSQQSATLVDQLKKIFQAKKGFEDWTIGYQDAIKLCLVRGLSMALIEAEYSKRKRREDHEREAILNEPPSADDPLDTDIYAILKSKAPAKSQKDGPCLAHVKRPYSMLAKAVVKLEFSLKCRAFMKIKSKVEVLAKKEEGCKLLLSKIDKTRESKMKEVVGIIRKANWASLAPILKGKVIAVNQKQRHPTLTLSLKVGTSASTASNQPAEVVVDLSGHKSVQENSSKKSENVEITAAKPAKKTKWPAVADRVHTITSEGKQADGTSQGGVTDGSKASREPVLTKKKIEQKPWRIDDLPRKSIYEKFKLSTKLSNWESIAKQSEDDPVRETPAFVQTLSTQMASYSNQKELNQASSRVFIDDSNGKMALDGYKTRDEPSAKQSTTSLTHKSTQTTQIDRKIQATSFADSTLPAGTRFAPQKTRIREDYSLNNYSSLASLRARGDQLALERPERRMIGGRPYCQMSRSNHCRLCCKGYLAGDCEACYSLVVITNSCCCCANV